MKRKISIFLVVVMMLNTLLLAGCVKLNGEKEPTPSEGLAFELNADGESCYVLGIGTCTDTDIVIPSTYNGKPVTSIGESAFEDCSSLTSVTIGNGVTIIGESAFYKCSSLTRITIPNSVWSIGDGAFCNCSSLASITVDEGNTVYHSDENCLIETSTKTLIAGCKNSTIPTNGSVTSIGNYAFEDCSSLTRITIPNSVWSIGGRAFAYCSGLTSITIPDSVTSIGESAFRCCSSLTSITFNGTHKQWYAIQKGDGWDDYTGKYTIHCTDDDISK